MRKRNWINSFNSSLSIPIPIPFIQFLFNSNSWNWNWHQFQFQFRNWPQPCSACRVPVDIFKTCCWVLPCSFFQDPMWYFARSKDGREGIIPVNYVTVRGEVKLHAMPWVDIPGTRALPQFKYWLLSTRLQYLSALAMEILQSCTKVMIILLLFSGIGIPIIMISMKFETKYMC